ncbi:hypothetical protein [Streptacidiphilus carbonis]|uniref:hypothetical protein n=1 Tax=Streptacidiphilus carbonis TaxID=105422 RepID=UPI0005A88AE8|nr:hypothetical protein [Streptacidiphilus carbonis]
MADRRIQARPSGPEVGPASFVAAAAALGMMDAAARTARHAPPDEPGTGEGNDPARALAVLSLLRQVREELGTWETSLIENARNAGATWADLAAPLGVASRQAAERRYLRLHPDHRSASTGEERVRATRDRRAADRAVAAWTQDHGPELRRLAAQVSALPDLGPGAGPARESLLDALGGTDPAQLLPSLVAARPYLSEGHRPLAARVDAMTAETGRLRAASDRQRGATAPPG